MVLAESNRYEYIYSLTQKLGSRSQLHSGFDLLSRKYEWFPCVAREYEACRERVGLIDMTSFSKLDVKGPDAVKFLQRLCSANVDKAVGSTIYTGK